MARNFFVMIFTLLILGSLWVLAERYGIERLPGNYHLKLGGSVVTVPILSCVVVSVLLSLLFRLMRRN